MNKSKEDIMTALKSNLPQKLREIKAEVSQVEIVTDTEEDYAYTRDRIKKLIDKAEESIDTMMLLAGDTEHPRAFEVLGQMFKTTSDMMDQLMTLQKKRKELTQTSGQVGASSGNTTNNAIFVGSTTELQKYLSNNG